MYAILWEYIVKAGRETEFEQIYCSNGDWAQLFKQDEGYLGTDLLRDTEIPRRYITIDRWVSFAAFDSFKAKYHREYEAIETVCEHLTEHEGRIGAGNSILLT